MIISKYNCIYFDDMVAKYVTMLNKPVIFIRSYGWNNSADEQKIQQSKEIYKNSLPLDVYTTMDQCEFSVIEIDDVEEAIEFCEDSFPESAEKCDPELYVYYKVFNAQGQVVASN
jgi:hypothetical protein